MVHHFVSMTAPLLRLSENAGMLLHRKQAAHREAGAGASIAERGRHQSERRRQVRSSHCSDPLISSIWIEACLTELQLLFAERPVPQPDV